MLIPWMRTLSLAVTLILTAARRVAIHREIRSGVMQTESLAVLVDLGVRGLNMPCNYYPG